MSEPVEQSDNLQYASLAAHQLRGPVATASMLLKTLLGEFAGPLNPQQKDMLVKAMHRCDQALETVQRMLALAQVAGAGTAKNAVTHISALLRQAEQRYVDEARRQKITFSIAVPQEPIYVRGYEPALIEVLDALLSNAMKYTPEHGRVQLSLSAEADGEIIGIAVGDSGVGIPEADRYRVFEPFFRSSRASSSSRPGTGLGLAFVKSVVETFGGSVSAETSELGGAALVVRLPAAPQPDAQAAEGDDKPPSLRVVIIGGAVAGPKAASKIIRLVPDAEVTIVERNQVLSSAGCGLPYYMSGIVRDPRELWSTPAGAVRDPVFFQHVKNVRLLNQTEALAVDPAQRLVRVRDCVSGRESGLPYDKLVIATGARPLAPPIPGANLDNIMSLHGLASAERIKGVLTSGRAHDVVVVGGGIIGVEITEMLVARGCRVTIVERQPQLLRILDWEIAMLVEQYLESKGVRILTETHVDAFEGETRVASVVTSQGPLSADLVILAIGLRPDVRLAETARLAIGETGAIKVDEYLRTSDPDIYAAGDCIETTDLITGRPTYVPYGSVANRHGRLAAINVCGGQERCSGTLGSAVCKVFDYCVGRTGLTEAAARSLGYDVVTVLAPAPDRAHYMPNARQILLKIVVDRQTRRLLGAQAVGPGMGEKRVDLATVAISAGMTVDQVANLDLSYAPPYSPVMDNLAIAANIARNKLDGHMTGISPMEVQRMLREKRDFFFLDVRTPAEHDQVRLPGATLIALGTLRGRLDELPRHREIIVFSRLSLRAYEASIILRSQGFKRVRVMDGGVEMWPYDKVQ